MASKKKADELDETPTKLLHLNGGATVTVPAHKAEALIAGGLFQAPKASKSAASSASK
jgi:hypothetical protein